MTKRVWKERVYSLPDQIRIAEANLANQLANNERDRAAIASYGKPARHVEFNAELSQNAREVERLHRQLRAGEVYALDMQGRLAALRAQVAE